ncbi:unnamed protein product [Urochloa humidicola]
MNETTPPQQLAGDPSAAIHPTPPLTGDPPAATSKASWRHAPSGRAHEGNLRPGSGGSSSSSSREEIPNRTDLAKKGDSRWKGPVLETAGVTGRSELRPGASYKEALMGVRTFKPRFDTSKQPGDWNDNSARRRPARSVWGRLGPSPASVHDRLSRPGTVHDRLGGRVPLKQQGISGFLQILKAKAVGRCYNCLARDHRIADCRDPPKCILCSRSGHKARLCPRRNPAPTSIWRRRASGDPPSLTPAPASSAGGSVPIPESAGGAASPSPKMDHILREAWRRPERVTACAARTSEVREAEQDLLLHTLIAVQIDARDRLTCEGVRQDALQQLHIPQRALQVTRISSTSFLLRLQSPEMRNAVYSRRAIAVGRTSLHLMPWARQVGAAAAVSNLFYRARVCFEGVPGHAHQVESVLHLLPPKSFVEGVDYERESEDEKGCFILWIWCQHPEAIAVLGTLHIEEPMVLPEEYHYITLDPPPPLVRSEAVTLLKYDVIIHLDRVEDYHPPARSPSRRSFDSDISGIPCNESTEQWPMRHKFDWQLGQPDALPEPPRMSVHARLGVRRDRSPPRGGGTGGGAGGGFQMPPPNQFDMSHSMFGGAGSNSCRNNAGPSHQGWNRNYDASYESQMENCLLVNKHLAENCCTMDPMLEEAAFAPRLSYFSPTLPQRSVEPTATDRVTEAAGLQVGAGLQAEKEDERQATIEEEMIEQAASKQDGPLKGILESIAEKTDHKNKDTLEVERDLGLEKEGEAIPLSSLEPQLRQEPTSNTPEDELIANQGNDGSLFGNLFDLNVECVIEGEMQDLQDATRDAMSTTFMDSDLQGRAALGSAEGRLNKLPKEGRKPGSKGVARLAVPLKKSLLCPPAIKPKTQQIKKSSCTENAVIAQTGKKCANMSIDEKATALLLKTTGIVTDKEKISDTAVMQFGNQFVTPLQNDLLGEMRGAFNMRENEGADMFSALISDAEDADD